MVYAKLGDDLVNGGREAGRAWAQAYRANRYHGPADEYDENWDWRGAQRELNVFYRIGRELAESDAVAELEPGRRIPRHPRPDRRPKANKVVDQSSVQATPSRSAYRTRRLSRDQSRVPDVSRQDASRCTSTKPRPVAARRSVEIRVRNSTLRCNLRLSQRPQCAKRFVPVTQVSDGEFTGDERMAKDLLAPT